ncbi:MAG: hypothetical protein Q4G69_06945 [Planctomycetia bacterium]|nr:hypothetical protein [Planctomycetia bacterium]
MYWKRKAIFFAAGTTLLFMFCIMETGISAEPMPRPLLGAIRWDAWYGKIPEGTKLRAPKSYPGIPQDLPFSPDPGAETRRALDEPMWYWRLPFYTEFGKDGKVSDINGTAREVLEKEIELASASGIDYWSFAFYPKDCPLSYTMQSYLTCPNRAKVPFCLFLILTHKNYGNFTRDPEMQKFALDLAARPEYLKVQGNRPVFFLSFFTDETLQAFREGVWENFCKQIEAKGLGRPYAIFNQPVLNREFKGDAISAYCPPQIKGEPRPYSDLVKNTESLWLEWEKSGMNVVPCCTAGWDNRPRMLHPVSWIGGVYSGKWIERYIISGSPQEIAAHIKNGVDWHKTHPSKDGVKLTIIYAWNEYDEGGWIAPTLPPPVGEGTARLDAIKKLLRPAY